MTSERIDPDEVFEEMARAIRHLRNIPVYYYRDEESEKEPAAEDRSPNDAA